MWKSTLPCTLALYFDQIENENNFEIPQPKKMGVATSCPVKVLNFPRIWSAIFLLVNFGTAACLRQTERVNSVWTTKRKATEKRLLGCWFGLE